MQLAVCAEMVFLDLPVTERVRRIAEAGFDAEIWDWTRHDIDALTATGAWAADGDTDRALTRFRAAFTPPAAVSAETR